MSIRDQAVTDFKNNLNQDGDPFVLIHETHGAYTFTGQITRIDTHLDPQTGIQVYEPKLVLSLSLLDLPTGWNEQDVTGFEAVDGFGRTTTGRVVTAFRDMTLAFINFVCEPLEEIEIAEPVPEEEEEAP